MSLPWQRRQPTRLAIAATDRDGDALRRGSRRCRISPRRARPRRLAVWLWPHGRRFRRRRHGPRRRCQKLWRGPRYAASSRDMGRGTTSGLTRQHRRRPTRRGTGNGYRAIRQDMIRMAASASSFLLSQPGWRPPGHQRLAESCRPWRRRLQAVAAAVVAVAAGGMPPRGERRFVPDEVITAFSSTATPQAIEQLARRYNLTQLESQSLPLIGATLYRWRINGRRPVGDLIGAIEDERIVARVQPNYIFSLQEDAPKTSRPTRQSYASQYVLGKLQVEQAHHIATGKNIPVAVIDSEIDVKHPDLDGAIVKSFDALGGDDKPHTARHRHGGRDRRASQAHGHRARRAAVWRRARSTSSAASAKATSFAIYKGLEWAADKGARVDQYELCRPARSRHCTRMLAALRQGHRADRGRRQCRAEIAAALSGRRSQRDRGDGDRRRTTSCSRWPIAAPTSRWRRPASTFWCRRPTTPISSPPGPRSPPPHVSGLAALLLECKPSLTPADSPHDAVADLKAARLRCRPGERLSRGEFAQCRSVGQGRRRAGEAIAPRPTSTSTPFWRNSLPVRCSDEALPCPAFLV